MWEYWGYCGEIDSLDLMRFPDTGRFKGICFITFKTVSPSTHCCSHCSQDSGQCYTAGSAIWISSFHQRVSKGLQVSVS